MKPPLFYDQKETLHDISFNMGFRWSAVNENLQESIMDSIGGSRGLVEQSIIWADEFDEMFVAKVGANPDYLEKYLEEVDNFFDGKWAAYIAGFVAERMTGEITSPDFHFKSQGGI